MPSEKPSKKEEKIRDGDTQYLKRVAVEETETANPIQGPVLSANALYHFMKDVQDSTVPKMWGIFLDEDYLSIGNEVLTLGESALPKNFSTASLFRFYYIFGATRFVLLTNHTKGDAAPTEEDRQLIQGMQVKAKMLDGVEFYDYVIVRGKQYWSMHDQNGTACHCGQQHYLSET